MAITNASDLLVYAKTSGAVKQITRISVKTTDPFIFPDGDTTARISINNITNSNGEVYDGIETSTSMLNTGASAIDKIKDKLKNTYNYQNIANGTSGDYTYMDFENGATGIVPTLEIADGLTGDIAILRDDSVIIEISTPGSSVVFDPVAFSTSASFSTNVDTIDCTNKDSGGYAEYKAGLKSFEVSTELLQSVNPDVPLDGTDFFHELSERDEVNVTFSDRIRNIIPTNINQSGVDGFLLSSQITQANIQADPFSGSTASKLIVASSSQSNRYLSYSVKTARITDKKINWSFYVKGIGSTTQVCFATSDTQTSPSSVVVKIEGVGSVSHLSGSYWTITGLSTSTWTRVSVQTKIIDSTSSDVSFYLYPGLYNSQNADEIFTSSWQIELSDDATDYQDPTNIKSFQGNALISSVSFDAGVEDNLTCSATFTGTNAININGLGPELIGDTEFDLANDGSNPASSWWTVSGGSLVENGYGKIIVGGSGNSSIKRSGLIVSGDTYLLTYTIPSASPGTGSIVIEDAATVNISLNKTTGTHKVQFKAGDNDLAIKRSDNPTDIWISSISLKKVL
mgnify:FL=1